MHRDITEECGEPLNSNVSKDEERFARDEVIERDGTAAKPHGSIFEIHVAAEREGAVDERAGRNRERVSREEARHMRAELIDVECPGNNQITDHERTFHMEIAGDARVGADSEGVFEGEGIRFEL